MSAMNTRQSTLGVLWLIYGVICLIKAASIALNWTVLTLMWGALLNRVPDPFTLMDVFHVFMLAVIVLAIITGVISLLAGMSLMQLGWSGRALVVTAAFLGLISGPLGIALGVYTLILFIPRPVVGNHIPPSAA